MSAYYYYFLVWAPSMQQKNYILVAFKVYLGASIVSACGYSGISKYLEIHIWSISSSLLAVYSQRLLSELDHKYFKHISNRKGLSLYLLMAYLRLLTHLHSYPFIPWQANIWFNTDCWSTYCSYLFTVPFYTDLFV